MNYYQYIHHHLTLLSNQFSIKAYTGPMVFHNNKNATGFTSAQITTVNYNPSQNPSSQTPFGQLSDGIVAFLDRFWQIITAIGLVLTVSIPAYQGITTDRRRVRQAARQIIANETMKRLEEVLSKAQIEKLTAKSYKKQLKYFKKLGIIPKKQYSKLEYMAVQDEKTHKSKLNL